MLLTPCLARPRQVCALSRAGTGFSPQQHALLRHRTAGFGLMVAALTLARLASKYDPLGIALRADH